MKSPDQFRVRLTLFILASAACVHSATLSAPSTMANPGGSVSVPLTFSSQGQSVSGLQFDITSDSALDMRVLPGAQAGISAKVLYTAALQPGVLRCVIIGQNSRTIADGELVRLFMAINPDATPRAIRLDLTNLSATDTDGNPLSLQADPINVRIEDGRAPQAIQSTGVLNAASLGTGPISPGEVITLFGSIPGSPVILVNDVPAPIIYAGLDQVNAIVPYGLDPSNPAQVEVRQVQSSTKISVPAAVASPAIFTLNATGIGPGAILNQDYSVNSASNRAARGSVIMIYGTGFGTLSPLPADGQFVQGLATTAVPVTATIDGMPATVLYAGAAPGLIAGLVQVNVLVPDGLNANAEAVILLNMGAYGTQPGVTVSIQ